MASGSGSGGEERWYFTQEQIQNSPSRKTGIDGDSEINNRQLTAYLIQEMGQRLQVSQLCINTAIVYMHRFYAFHSFSEFHQNGIATASLFLAAKVEEQPRKLEHVIKAAAMCLKQEVPDPSKDNYQEMAQDLVFNENVLLQTLGFDVAIDHPHTHVVKTCHLVCGNSCKDLAQTSYFLASNSLHLTTMCLQYKPTVVACFCIYLACKWSRWEIPQSTEGKYWFYYVDKTVTAELLEQLTDDFLSIYEKSPGRLKIKLNSIMALAQSVKHENPPPARPLKEPIVVSGTSSSSRSQQPNRITPASSSSSSSSHHRSQHPASYTPNTTYHHTNKKHVPSEHPSKGSSQQLPSSNAPMQKPTHPAIPTTATSSSTSSSQQRQPRFDRLTNVKHSTPPPTSSSLIPPSATTNNNSQLQSSSTSASSSASRNSTGGTSSNHNAPFAGRPGVSGHNDVINNNHLSGTTANARDAAARNRMSATNPHQQQLSQERYQAKAEAQQQRHLLGGKDNKLSGSDSNNMLKKQVNSFSASNNNSNSKNSIEMQRNSGNSNMSGGSIPASSSAGMGQSMNSQNPRHTSYSQPPNYNQAMANKQQQQYSQQQIGEQPNNNSSSSSMSVQKSSSADLFRLTDDLVSRPMEQCSPAQQSRPSGGISNSNNNSSSLNKAPSIFSPESEWNDPLPPPVEKLSSKMMVNNHALPPSSNNGLAVLSNKPIKDSPKKHERRSETPTKHKQHRLDQHPTTPTSQSSKMKTDMRSSSTSLSGGGVKKEVVDGFPSVYKRPFDQDNTMSMNTVVKQERDEYMRESKVRKVDIDRVPSPKNMAAVPPQNLLVDTKPSKMMSSTTLNGIETNPDLVSSLLKESLFNDSKLSLRTGGYVGSIKKELDYMEEEDVKPLAVEPDDDSLHRSKSEKKKKKEKHKHKEKDKSKEERKKHKKDKERHKDRPTEGGMPDVHNPIKITIPKDKLNMTAHDGSSMNADRSQTHHGAGMISAPNVTGGFKIKIPKDRIKQHEFHHGNGGGNNEDSNMAGQPPLPPPSSSSSGNSQTSLKIKISKDVIENFNRDGGGSSGHHHHHSSASGGHHVGDVYAGHGHSSKKKDRDRDRSRDREREKAAKKLEHSKMNGANVQVVNNYHGGGNGSIGQNAMPPRANTTAPGPNKMMQMSSNTSQYMSQSNPMMKVGQQHPAPPPYNVHQQPPSHNISGESGGNSNHGRMSSGDQQQYNNYYYSNKK